LINLAALGIISTSVKWDGYRAIAEVSKTDMRLISRNNIVPSETEETVAEAEHKTVKSTIKPSKDERRTLLNPREETQTRKINGKELKFTHLSKVYWPDDGFTKRHKGPKLIQAAQEVRNVLGRTGCSMLSQNFRINRNAYLHTA
jgi:hypothetical protein